MAPERGPVWFPVSMDPLDISRYRNWLKSNPSAFVEGARGFCKQAGIGGTWRAIKPWVLALLGGYLAMRAGSAWGRYANRTDNPNGPIKGPFLKILEGALPEGEKLVYPGTKAYDDIIAYRTKQDDAKWDAMFDNSVSEGRAKSLTMRR